MDRKYTGAMRIVPLREQLRLAADEDSPYSYQGVIQDALRAGFPSLAREALLRACAEEGKEPCFNCMTTLGSGNHGRFWSRSEKCQPCEEAYQAKWRKKPRRVQQPQHRRRLVENACQRCFGVTSNVYECERCSSEKWPWYEVRDRKAQYGKRWVLMRKWEHLRAALPDPNDNRSWTAGLLDSRRIAQILENDRRSNAQTS